MTNMIYHFSPKSNCFYSNAEFYFFILGEPSKLKMSQNLGKVHNFLDPPPSGNVDYFEFEKKMKFDVPPPLGPNLGKNWNVDYFEIFAPPLILAKSAPKLLDPCKNSTKMLSNCYNETISFIYQPYMYQMLPLSHQYLTNIISSTSRPYFRDLNLRKFGKSWPPSFQKYSTFWFVNFLIVDTYHAPILDCFHFMGHFFYGSHKRPSSDDQKVFLKKNWDCQFLKVMTN